MKIIKRNIYKNRDDPKPKLAFKDGTGAPIDLSAVVRLILTINPDGTAPVEVDTAIDPGSMVIASNTITFDIAELPQVVAMTQGDYYIGLVAIDGVGKASQLVHEDHLSTRVIFSIRDTASV